MTKTFVKSYNKKGTLGAPSIDTSCRVAAVLELIPAETGGYKHKNIRGINNGISKKTSDLMDRFTRMRKISHYLLAPMFIEISGASRQNRIAAFF